MILGDRYALYRDPRSGEPVGEPEWTDWDYALVNALQLIEDFSDQNGLLVWEKESDDVLISAVKKVDPFESAKERTTGRKNYKATPGEYFIPDVKLQHWATEWPTFQDWVKSQNDSEEEAPPPEEPVFVQN